MKVFLMHEDADFDMEKPLPPQEPALTQDLDVMPVMDAMADGDPFLLDVAKHAMMGSLTNLEAIQYRQEVLRDGLNHSSTLQNLYDVALESLEIRRKHHFGIFANHPGTLLSESRELLRYLVDALKKVRTVADEQAPSFESRGFQRFFARIHEELTDDYFAVIQTVLKDLEFPNGVLLGAELGAGNKGVHLTLCKSPGPPPTSWVTRMFGNRPTVYGFHVAERDEAGARALSDLIDRGINTVANALAQSDDHILAFFGQLRVELAFYIGCIHLHEALTSLQEPICFPIPIPVSQRTLSADELYDASLALRSRQRVVGNDLRAGDKDLLIVTGANQGGKTTFLRSVGLAQLMMQSGMFVPARACTANVCSGVFTHFRREEDRAMSYGKFEEELERMSDIVHALSPGAMVLWNESFAATNEREGSEIATQITLAFVERRIKVVFVTHLYAYAEGFYHRTMSNALFLRAERTHSGKRTFRIVEGEPLETSYAKDLYDKFLSSTTFSDHLSPST